MKSSHATAYSDAAKKQKAESLEIARFSKFPTQCQFYSFIQKTNISVIQLFVVLLELDVNRSSSFLPNDFTRSNTFLYRANI